MLRASLIIFLMMVVNVAQIPAQEKIATLEPMRDFDGYPRDRMVGSKGHTTRGSWFTGRWYCAVIAAGVIGEPVNIPFTTGRPIKDERIVAIVAVDTESETTLCLSITPEFQPRWDGEFRFRILTKDVFCLTALKENILDESDDCSFLTVSLSDKTIEVEQMPLTSAKRHLRALAIDPHAGRKLLDGDGGVLPKQDSKDPLWTLGDGWGGLDDIYIGGEPDPKRFIGPGSRDGRLIQCEIIGPGQFSICERDANPAGRQYWLLSEMAIEPQSKGKQSKIDHLYFPQLLIAPVNNFVFAAAAANSSPTLFNISNGRLRRLWDAPPGYGISGLQLSENESHAAVELSADADSSNSDVAVSIKVATGDATVFSEPTEVSDFLFLVGVTNRGDLVQENASVGGCRLYVRRRGWQNPRQVVRLVREP